MEILERFEDGSVIALLEIEKLHDHEQIKPDRLEEMINELKKDGEVKYPIIVDKYSNVVLDGHHRFYALKNLGCRFAPAFVIDYYDPHIKIERWYPLVKTKREVKSIFKALETDGYSIEQVKNEDVLKVVMDLGQACLGLIVENDHEEFYLAHKNYCNFQEAMEVVKHAIEIEGKRKELDHIGNESEAIAMLKSKEARMAIISPQIKKSEVVEKGITGNPLPPKSTRHVLPEKKYYPVSLTDLMPK